MSEELGPVGKTAGSLAAIPAVVGIYVSLAAWFFYAEYLGRPGPFQLVYSWKIRKPERGSK